MRSVATWPGLGALFCLAALVAVWWLPGTVGQSPPPLVHLMLVWFVVAAASLVIVDVLFVGYTLSTRAVSGAATAARRGSPHPRSVGGALSPRPAGDGSPHPPGAGRAARPGAAEGGVDGVRGVHRSHRGGAAAAVAGLRRLYRRDLADRPAADREDRVAGRADHRCRWCGVGDQHQGRPVALHPPAAGPAGPGAGVQPRVRGRDRLHAALVAGGRGPGRRGGARGRLRRPAGGAARSRRRRWASCWSGRDSVCRPTPRPSKAISTRIGTPSFSISTSRSPTSVRGRAGDQRGHQET